MNTPYQPNQERIRKLRTMLYEEYLRTPEWAQKRDQTLERDGYRCRVCNSSERLLYVPLWLTKIFIGISH